MAGHAHKGLRLSVEVFEHKCQYPEIQGGSRYLKKCEPGTIYSLEELVRDVQGDLPEDTRDVRPEIFALAQQM